VARVLSLKVRSYLLSVLVVGGVWSVTAWFSYQSSSDVVHRLIDEQLRHEMGLVRRQVGFAIANFDTLNPDLGNVLWDNDRENINRAILFWNDAGKLLVASVGAPALSRPEQEGLSTKRIANSASNDGETWRVLYEPVATNINVAVVINEESAEQYIREIGIGSLQPLLVAIPISIIGVLLGFTFSWRPLKELLAQVSTRSAKSLQPIPTGQAPIELEPFITALNTLMQRLGRALESEHQFTANAAHELQTPLAAIKTEVQLCQRRNHDTAVADMLNRIEERVDRATDMVKQLLMLARLEASESNGASEEVDLNAVLVDNISNIAHLLIEQNRDIEFDEGKPVIVQGNPQLLGILVKNLLDNALLYATENGRIQAGCQIGDEGQIELYVANDSPPIPASQRDKMLETFYRLPGSSGKGSGLGLSIVQRIAEIHSAKLMISNWHEGRGIKISIRFS
jgi:signal transduction histidine kinase